MDMLRSGKIAKMRLWQNDNTEILVRWFRAEPDALVFEQPSYLRSSTWDDFDWIRPVGENKDNGSTWERGLNFAGLDGKHHCGSDSALANGGIHGVDPPITTNAEGTSPCCDLPIQRYPIGFGAAPIPSIQMVDSPGIGMQPIGTQGYNTPPPLGIGMNFHSIQAAMKIDCHGVWYGNDIHGNPWSAPYLTTIESLYLTCTTGFGCSIPPEEDVKAWLDCSISGGTFVINGSSGIAGLSLGGPGVVQVIFSTPPPLSVAGVGLVAGAGNISNGPMVVIDQGILSTVHTFWFYDVTGSPDWPNTIKALWTW